MKINDKIKAIEGEVQKIDHGFVYHKGSITRISLDDDDPEYQRDTIVDRIEGATCPHCGKVEISNFSETIDGPPCCANCGLRLTEAVRKKFGI